MAEDEPRLTDLLKRFHLTAQERLDFHRTDPESVAANVRLLTAATYYFNAVAVADFGGRVGGVRERGLVEQVVAAAFQTFENTDPHPGPFEKAAMLLRGVTQGHPFTDGNKRTGWLVASYYLEVMGYPRPAELPVEQIVDFSLQVSAGAIRDVPLMAGRLKELWNVPTPRP